MSSYKEPGFFAFDFSAGQEPGLGQVEAYSKCMKTRESYLALFADVDHERAIGEASPQYLSIPGAATRIRQHLPDVRLIALLRHPADRLYSGYQSRCMLNLDPCKSFEDALVNSSYDYRRHPTYWVSLEPYYRCFSRDQIHIILYESFAKETSATVADTFRFLEVDPDFQVDTTRRYYQSRIIQYARLRSRLAKGSRFADGLRMILPRLPSRRSNPRQPRRQCRWLPRCLRRGSRPRARFWIRRRFG